jgi:hypothetical protein
MVIARIFLKLLILVLVCSQTYPPTFAWWMQNLNNSVHPQSAVMDKSALAFYSHAGYFCVTVTDQMDPTVSLGDTYGALMPLSQDEYQHFAVESLKRSDWQRAALYALSAFYGRVYQCGSWISDPFIWSVYSVQEIVESADRSVKSMPNLIEDTIRPRSFPRTVEVELKPGQWLQVRCDTPDCR